MRRSFSASATKRGTSPMRYSSSMDFWAAKGAMEACTSPTTSPTSISSGWKLSRPASMRAISKVLLMSDSSSLWLLSISCQSRSSSVLAAAVAGVVLSPVPENLASALAAWRSRSRSAKAMDAARGVFSSWLIMARKSLRYWFSSVSASLASSRAALWRASSALACSRAVVRSVTKSSK